MAIEISQQARIEAAEASELRDHPAFRRAVLGARRRCLDDLAGVDPLKPEEIRTIQARIRAIDLLAEMLADEIIRGTASRQVVAA